MIWFFTTILIYAGQPPLTDRQGPYMTQEACETARIELLAVMRDLKATPCLPQKKAKHRG